MSGVRVPYGPFPFDYHRTESPMDATIQFTVNGRRREVTTDPDRPLLDVLREDLGLTGTKYGCGEGQCGACSVLVDGKRVFSCRTGASTVAGKSVLTVEGLSTGEKLHPVQEAFLAESAFQCGYCTPGMVIAAGALLKADPAAAAGAAAVAAVFAAAARRTSRHGSTLPKTAPSPS